MNWCLPYRSLHLIIIYSKTKKMNQHLFEPANCKFGDSKWKALFTNVIFYYLRQSKGCTFMRPRSDATPNQKNRNLKLVLKLGGEKYSSHLRRAKSNDYEYWSLNCFIKVFLLTTVVNVICEKMKIFKNN